MATMSPRPRRLSLAVWCDNTTEMLAASLRPGNAGSNTTSDHIEILTAAIAEVPAPFRKRLLVRADGAGASQDWLTEPNIKPVSSVDYSVGFAVTQAVGDAIALVPEGAWAVGGRRRRRGPRRRSRRRDHRAARPAQLAGRNAAHRPPGTASSRRPNCPVGGGRRVALPGLATNTVAVRRAAWPGALPARRGQGIRSEMMRMGR